MKKGEYCPDGNELCNTAFDLVVEMESVLEECDSAFVNWQLGQIPGRPEDILVLISKVRKVLKKAKEGGE